MAIKTEIKTLEHARLNLEELTKKREATEAAHKAEYDIIRNEEIRLCKLNQPFNEMTDTLAGMEQRLANSHVQRATLAQWDRDVVDFIEVTIGHDHSASFQGAFDNAWQSHKYDATRLIPIIDQWQKKFAAEIEALKKERVDYANANDLAYLLK